MRNIPINFMVNLNSNPNRNLSDSIRQLKNNSAGFVNSWQSNELDEAQETSQEAFKHLDHIQNEFLRHRDDKSRLPNWISSPFHTTLTQPVGKIIKNLQQSDAQWFAGLSAGNGSLIVPSQQQPVPLSLELALNKMKHRDILRVNFVISPNHILYVHTNGVKNIPDSLSAINISDFCKECKNLLQFI